MTQQWIDVKAPKDIIYVIILLFVLFNLGILFFIYLYTTRETSVQWKLLANIVGGAYILVGWGAPIYLYFRVPIRIKISDAEILLEMKTGKIIKLSKEDIPGLNHMISPLTKEPVYGLCYDKKNPTHAYALDIPTGKLVYDWYYGEGQKKREEELPPYP